jgi:hypothetical protein
LSLVALTISRGFPVSSWDEGSANGQPSLPMCGWTMETSVWGGACEAIWDV